MILVYLADRRQFHEAAEILKHCFAVWSCLTDILRIWVPFWNVHLRHLFSFKKCSQTNPWLVSRQNAPKLADVSALILLLSPVPPRGPVGPPWPCWQTSCSCCSLTHWAVPTSRSLFTLPLRPVQSRCAALHAFLQALRFLWKSFIMQYLL